MDLIIQMIAQEADECAWAPSGPIDSQHDETIYTIIYEYESSLQVNINCIRIRFCYSAIRAAFSLGLHMSQLPFRHAQSITWEYTARAVRLERLARWVGACAQRAEHACMWRPLEAFGSQCKLTRSEESQVPTVVTTPTVEET